MTPGPPTPSHPPEVTVPFRLFLVDDHPWLLETQAHMLDLEPDLEVAGTAPDAETALERLPDEVDLAVVDLTLPGMSGLDLIRALVERRPGLPCLVLSAYPAVQHAAAARDAGAVDYVEKGDPYALLAAIRHALT